MPIDVNLDGFRKRCYNISEDQLLRAGTLPFFIMRFLEGTDILVAEMPKSVFADMQQASEIAIEKKIDHTDVSFTPDEKFSDIISFTSEI